MCTDTDISSFHYRLGGIFHIHLLFAVSQPLLCMFKHGYNVQSSERARSLKVVVMAFFLNHQYTNKLHPD